MKIISTFFVLLFSVIAVMAQTQYRDVVALKNGGLIKGIIIEQVPNDYLKIETADGSIFVYKMSEVEKMSKEKIEIAKPKDERTAQVKKDDPEGTRYYKYNGAEVKENKILSIEGFIKVFPPKEGGYKIKEDEWNIITQTYLETATLVQFLKEIDEDEFESSPEKSRATISFKVVSFKYEYGTTTTLYNRTEGENNTYDLKAEFKIEINNEVQKYKKDASKKIEISGSTYGFDRVKMNSILSDGLKNWFIEFFCNYIQPPGKIKEVVDRKGEKIKVVELEFDFNFQSTFAFRTFFLYFDGDNVEKDAKGSAIPIASGELKETPFKKNSRSSIDKGGEVLAKAIAENKNIFVIPILRNRD